MSMRAIATIIVLGLCLSAAPDAHAVVFWGERIITVHDLPDTPENRSELGEQVDLGIKTGQVRLLGFIPLWHYGEQEYVFTVEGDSGKFYECMLTNAELEAEFKGMGESLPGLGFWNTVGGKMLAVLVVLIGMVFTGARGGGAAAATNQPSGEESDPRTKTGSEAS